MVSVDNVKSGAAKKGATPVEQMTADANHVEYATDSRGRKIGCKKLTFLDSHRLTCILGEDARNEAALNQALVVASVCEIAGDPVALPRTLVQLHALMARLDFAGVQAATEAMVKFVAPSQTDDSFGNSVKNS